MYRANEIDLAAQHLFRNRWGGEWIECVVVSSGVLIDHPQLGLTVEDTTQSVSQDLPITHVGSLICDRDSHHSAGEVLIARTAQKLVVPAKGLSESGILKQSSEATCSLD